jgi:hypothetical protein
MAKFGLVGGRVNVGAGVDVAVEVRTGEAVMVALGITVKVSGV